MRLAMVFVATGVLLAAANGCRRSAQVRTDTVSSSPASRSSGTVTIRADRGWQPTGIRLSTGQRFVVSDVHGQIRDRDAVIDGGAGSDYTCGNPGCCEPMPNERRSALVGRVGAATVFVGNGGPLTSPGTGELQLRVNDCNDGLLDNQGSLEALVTADDATASSGSGSASGTGS